METTKKLTQGQFILTYLENKTGKTEFSINEIYKAIQSDEEFETKLNELSLADYMYWQENYLASLFRRYTVIPKKPKIKREKQGKTFYYSLIK